MSATAVQAPSFLAGHEAPPYRVENAGGRAPLVLTCDHASHAVPESLANLGLDEEDLRRHIGWDIGAAEVTLRLADRLDAPAVLGGYSRLVIDLNRAPGSPTSIPEVSDGTRIPGNEGLNEADAGLRADELFSPYHDAVARSLRSIRDRGEQPVFVAIHSFTKSLRSGFARPWDYGVLWDADARIATRLIAALRRVPGLLVGDNEPYSARDHFDFSQDHHARSNGFASALVEIRDDLIRDRAGAERHSEILGDALKAALPDPAWGG